VKTLDYEQKNVKATLEVVEQVAELKSCVLGVHGSMGAPQDWETAASYLHRASQIPDEVIDGEFAQEIVPTAEVPDRPRETIEAAAESLCALFLREFEKAAREGDGARVTRFFKLFPLIGRISVGLEAYGRYVCGGIASRARSNMNSAGQRREGMFYANALTKLFEHIAQIVAGHEPLVERHYGPGSMVKVIERIQVEADSQGGLILDTWAEERRVSRKLTDVKSYPFNFLVSSFLPSAGNAKTGTTRSSSPGSGRPSEDEGVDMKEVDALLSESAVMLGRWSLYTRFLASKTVPLTDAEDAALHLPAFIIHSTLQKRVNDLLIEPFNLMATFFFRRSVEKSFQQDESPASELTLSPNKPLNSNPPFITSAVDDVMYIVNQVLQRTLSTSQRPIVSGVLPSLGRVLGSDFFGMIQRKMRDESYPKAAIQGALPPEGLIISFLVLINNLDVATDYVHRIVNTCLGEPTSSSNATQQLGGMGEGVLSDSFPFGNESQMVAKSLRTLDNAFSVKTSELINEALEVLQKQVMRPRLRPVLVETFREVTYDISTEDSGVDGEETEGVAELVTRRFERGWNAFTLPLKRILTPVVFEKLLTGLITYLADRLEKRIYSLYGRVTELGAIRLERDIAGVVAAAVKGGKYDLRDSFARCVQMTLVMNMEEDEWEEVVKLGEVGDEALERETGVSWKLDGEERRRVRGIVKARG
jgi:hypothetical protein